MTAKKGTRERREGTKGYREAKEEAVAQRREARENQAEWLWERGVPRWVVDRFWAKGEYIVDFAYAHPDRFNLARAPA